MDDPELMNLNYRVITEHERKTPWNKIILLITILLLILILIVALIIIYMMNNEIPESEEINIKNDLAEIKCIYNVQSLNEETEILSKEFNETSKLHIYINGTEIPYSKNIKFNTTGNNEVLYVLKEDINMDNMFKNISTLISINLTSYNDNDIKIISMESSFYNCINLKEFSLSGFNTSEITSLKNLFYNTQLSSIKSFDISSKSITDMSYAFANTSLISLDLSNLDTSQVSNMSYMFSNMTLLNRLKIENFDTSNVIDFSYMFYSCKSLSILDLSNFNTEKGVYMQNLFQKCNNLKSLDVSKFNTENVINISHLFDGCESLNELKISDWNIPNLKDTSYMFKNCISLFNLDLSNVKLSSQLIDMSYMFYNLLPGEFASLDLSGFDTSKITNMKGMFEGIQYLRILNLSNFDISKVDNISKMLYDMEDITFLDLTGFNFENIEDDQINEFFNPKLYLKFLNIKDIKSKDAFIDLINNLEREKNICIYVLMMQI